MSLVFFFLPLSESTLLWLGSAFLYVSVIFIVSAHVLSPFLPPFVFTVPSSFLPPCLCGFQELHGVCICSCLFSLDAYIYLCVCVCVRERTHELSVNLRQHEQLCVFLLCFHHTAIWCVTIIHNIDVIKHPQPGFHFDYQIYI